MKNQNDIFRFFLYETFLDDDGVWCLNNLSKTSFVAIRRLLTPKYLTKALGIDNVSIDWEGEENSTAVIYSGEKPYGEFRVFG